MSIDKMRNEILTKLVNRFTTEQLQDIQIVFDSVANNYEVLERCTELVQYGYVPEEVKTYVVIRKIEGLSDKTLKGYKLILDNFFEVVKKQLNEITSNDVRCYLYYLSKEKKNSNRSIEGKRLVLNGFFNWCVLEGYMKANPCSIIKPIKYEKEQKPHLTQYELEMIREACKTTRERALVEFLYSTGCRVSEVVGMNVFDIDFRTKEIKIFGKGSKHRTGYMNAKAEMWIKKYLSERIGCSDALFIYDRKPYGRLQKDGIEKIIRDLNKRAGITKNVTPHTFRHTTATTAVANGMAIQEVQKVLGHVNIATTMIYAEVAASDIKHHHAKCVI